MWLLSIDGAPDHDLCYEALDERRPVREDPIHWPLFAAHQLRAAPPQARLALARAPEAVLSRFLRSSFLARRVEAMHGGDAARSPRRSVRGSACRRVEGSAAL